MSMRTKSSLYSTEIDVNKDLPTLYRTIQAADFPDSTDPLGNSAGALPVFLYDGAGNVAIRFWADIADGAWGKQVEVWLYERGRLVANPDTSSPNIFVYAAAELLAKLTLTFSGQLSNNLNPVNRVTEGTSWVSASGIAEVAAGDYIKSENLVQILDGIADSGADIDNAEFDGASAIIQLGRLMGIGLLVYVKSSAVTDLDTLLIEVVPQS